MFTSNFLVRLLLAAKTLMLRTSAVRSSFETNWFYTNVYIVTFDQFVAGKALVLQRSAGLGDSLLLADEHFLRSTRGGSEKGGVFCVVGHPGEDAVALGRVGVAREPRVRRPHQGSFLGAPKVVVRVALVRGRSPEVRLVEIYYLRKA